jgi:hypothetical protein
MEKDGADVGEIGRTKKNFHGAVDPSPVRSSAVRRETKVMKYMLLIYQAEGVWASLSQEEQGRVFGEYMAFTNDLKTQGKLVAGDPLEPTSTATTVRVRNGKPVHTDGPFAETKEALGGYYIIDVKDLNEALAWAAKIPDARSGSIEVRPLMDMPA